jgi:hypothetical protein
VCKICIELYSCHGIYIDNLRLPHINFCTLCKAIFYLYVFRGYREVEPASINIQQSKEKYEELSFIHIKEKNSALFPAI